MRILVTDGMDKTALETLRAKGHEVVEQFYAPEELGEAIRDFDVVVVRSATKVRANHIDAAKGSRLKLIIRGGVGVDNIDVKYAEENGITVKLPAEDMDKAWKKLLKLNKTQGLLKRKLTIIDLRFANKVLVKPRRTSDEERLASDAEDESNI